MRLGGTRTLAILSTILVAPAIAHAGDSEAKARAKRLFEQGMRAIEAHDRATGCEKLRESLAIFAVPNTLFNVAECDEYDGKFALAYDHWQRGIALLGAKDARIKVAKKRLDTLEARVARLRIVVPPSVASAKIVFDDAEIAVSALSEPLVVDVGKHVVVTQAEGHEDHKQEVTLAARDRTEVVAQLGAVKKLAQKPVNTAGPKLRIGAFVGYGVAAAAGIAAGVTGGVLLSRDKQIQGHCKNFACDEAGYQLAQGQGPLLVGNAVAWGVGGAAAVTGVVLTILWKQADKTESAVVVPFIAPSVGGLGVIGRF